MRAYGDGQAGELNDKLARGAKGEGFGAAGLAHSGGLTVLGLPDQLCPLAPLDALSQVARPFQQRSGQVKVLMLLPDPAVKGAMARLGARLMEALRQLDAEVVACRWGRHADRETPLASACGRVTDIVRIRRLLRSGEFDVLFVNTAHDRRALLRDVPLLVTTRGLVRRRVIQFHGSLSNELSMPGRPIMKAASRWLARNADAVLMLSSEEADQWRAFEPRGWFRVVTNPYVHDSALASRRKGVGGTPDAAPVVLFVGRLLAAKGIFDLVDAVAKVRRLLDCRLYFAGDGRDEDALVRRVRDVGLEHAVRLLGHLQPPDLAEAYRTADVFALPSYSEGFATVLTEAMDVGLPIVTTGIRGAVDHLEEGKNALFVPPGRADLLADALFRLLTDDALRKAMAAANQAKVRDFAPSVVAKDYLRLLQAVLEGDASDAGGA